MLRTRPDYIAALETAYQVALDEADWLEELAGAVARLFSTRAGAYALTYDAETDVVGHWRSSGLKPDVVAAILRPFCDGGPDGSVATKFCSKQVWQELARPFPRATTMSSLFPPEKRDPLMSAFLAQGNGQLGVRGTDVVGSGVIIGTPWSAAVLKTRDSLPLEQLGTHLAAAYRLRRALVGRAPLGAAEAIFSSRGTLEHLELGGEGEDESRLDEHALAGGSGARRDATSARLGRGVAEVREAVGRLRTLSPTRALALWRGLFDGRWSLVAHTDRDGKRFLLAFKNPPGVREQAGLSYRERQIVTLLAFGASFKQACYELGLAPATVSTHLRGALRTLGIRDLRQLALLSQLVPGKRRDSANR